MPCCATSPQEVESSWSSGIHSIESIVSRLEGEMDRVEGLVTRLRQQLPSSSVGISDVYDTKTESTSSSLPIEGNIRRESLYFRRFESIYRSLLDEMLKIPVKDRKYIVVHASGGWGNKLRTYMGAYKLCVVLRRICLINLEWFPDFFERPWSPFLISDTDGLRGLREVNVEIDSGNTKKSILQCQFAESFPQPVIHLKGWATVEHELHQCAEYVYSLARLGVPIHMYQYAVEFLEAVLARQTEGIKNNVVALKKQMEWDRYKLFVGVHLRVCVDCPWRVTDKPEKLGWIWECTRELVKKEQATRGVTPAETLIFFATDDPPRKKDAQAGLAEVGNVKVTKVDRFVNSDRSSARAELTQILSEWLILGDTNAMSGSGTTFSQFAALRRNIPFRVFTHKQGKECKWVIFSNEFPRLDMAY